jgi:hypothetical protein
VPHTGQRAPFIKQAAQMDGSQAHIHYMGGLCVCVGSQGGARVEVVVQEDVEVRVYSSF